MTSSSDDRQFINAVVHYALSSIDVNCTLHIGQRIFGLCQNAALPAGRPAAHHRLRVITNRLRHELPVLLHRQDGPQVSMASLSICLLTPLHLAAVPCVFCGCCALQPDADVRMCCRVNLNAAQIVEQVIMARRLLAADAALLPADQAPSLTNVVSVLQTIGRSAPACHLVGALVQGPEIDSLLFRVVGVHGTDPLPTLTQPLVNLAKHCGGCYSCRSHGHLRLPTVPVRRAWGSP
jgi:hypothetical protein